MPNWKKVITSGSNAALNNITASRLTLESSGSTIFDVVGSQGQLFSITDSLSGSLFAVSDISGLPILEVFSDDTVKIGSFNNEAIIVSGSNATITGSFTGSFTGDGSNLTNLPSSDPFPYTGSAVISGSLEVTGSVIVTGDITTNTLSNISTTLASDSATNVDTFATATYTGAIYDYILVDATVGARTGQFMVAQDNGNITFTDTSTKHLTDSPIPEITAQINGANVEVQVTNGDGYTFKSFTKKL